MPVPAKHSTPVQNSTRPVCGLRRSANRQNSEEAFKVERRCAKVGAGIRVAHGVAGARVDGGPMPTSRQRERRDRLFTAAQQAVVMHGADVRLKDIADMAGLTSGAILYHYPDVQSLLLEANQAVIERFLDNRVKAIRGLASPAEKLVVTVARRPAGRRRGRGREAALRARWRRLALPGVRRHAHLALRPPGRDVPGDPRGRRRPRRLRPAAATRRRSAATSSPSRTPTATGWSPDTARSTTPPPSS